MMNLVALCMVAQLAGNDGGSKSLELESSWNPRFDTPLRLRAAGEFLRVEEPGFACPSWIDLDGDGQEELVVGQLKEGRMRAYPGLAGGQFGPGSWLQAEGTDLLTPGVW